MPWAWTPASLRGIDHERRRQARCRAFAYGEAARHRERALVVQELADTDDIAERCDFLVALSKALFPAGATERVIEQTAPEALQLADRLGDPRRAFRACRLALDSLDARGAATSLGRPEFREWAERAQRSAEPDSIERVHADSALAASLGADVAPTGPPSPGIS